MPFYWKIAALTAFKRINSGANAAVTEKKRR